MMYDTSVPVHTEHEGFHMLSPMPSGKKAKTTHSGVVVPRLSIPSPVSRQSNDSDTGFPLMTGIESSSRDALHTNSKKDVHTNKRKSSISKTAATAESPLSKSISSLAYSASTNTKNHLEHKAFSRQSHQAHGVPVQHKHKHKHATRQLHTIDDEKQSNNDSDASVDVSVKENAKHNHTHTDFNARHTPVHFSYAQPKTQSFDFPDPPKLYLIRISAPCRAMYGAYIHIHTHTHTHQIRIMRSCVRTHIHIYSSIRTHISLTHTHFSLTHTYMYANTKTHPHTHNLSSYLSFSNCEVQLY